MGVITFIVTDMPLGSSVTVVMTGLTLNVLVLVMKCYNRSICAICVHHHNMCGNWTETVVDTNTYLFPVLCHFLCGYCGYFWYL